MHSHFMPIVTIQTVLTGQNVRPDLQRSLKTDRSSKRWPKTKFQNFCFPICSIFVTLQGLEFVTSAIACNSCAMEHTQIKQVTLGSYLKLGMHQYFGSRSSLSVVESRHGETVSDGCHWSTLSSGDSSRSVWRTPSPPPPPGQAIYWTSWKRRVLHNTQHVIGRYRESQRWLIRGGQRCYLTG